MTLVALEPCGVLVQPREGDLAIASGKGEEANQLLTFRKAGSKNAPVATTNRLATRTRALAPNERAVFEVTGTASQVRLLRVLQVGRSSSLAEG